MFDKTQNGSWSRAVWPGARKIKKIDKTEMNRNSQERKIEMAKNIQ